MKKLCIKSILLGAAIVFSIFILLGFGGGSSGKYQISATSEGGAYLLNSQTGEIKKILFVGYEDNSPQLKHYISYKYKADF